jgi:hypothetical protein
VHRCRTDDVERVQLKAQFSQALVAGIHRDTHNSPQDPDPARQLATAYERQGEKDLAGQEAIGGSGSGQPRERGHGAERRWRVLWLLPLTVKPPNDSEPHLKDERSEFWPKLTSSDDNQTGQLRSNPLKVAVFTSL